MQNDLVAKKCSPQYGAALLRAASLCLLTGLCSAPPLAKASESTLQKLRAGGELRIGYRSSAVPFSYLVPGTETPIGYAVEICQRIAVKLQQELKLPRMEIKFVQADGQNRFDALKQDKIDLECGNTTNTRERREKLGFAFSIPYFITGTRLLVHSASKIHDTGDLRERAVAVVKNTTGTAQLRKEDENRSLRLRYIEISNRAEAFELLEAQKVDAFLQDDVVLYSLRSSAGRPSNYAIVNKFLTIEPLAIMFRAEDAELKKFADLQIAGMISNGEFAALYSKWFEKPIPPKHLNFDMPMNYLMRDLLRFPTDKLSMFPE